MAEERDPLKAQTKTPFTVIIDDSDDWRRFVPATLDLSHVNLGTPEIEAGLRKVAEINGVSFELVLAGYLAWRKKFEMVELEVETVNHPEWGKMVWIPDHPAYSEPAKDSFEKLFQMNFYRAMFQTEKAGVQRFCLYSTAINGRFHKSLVLRKIVLKTVE